MLHFKGTKKPMQFFLFFLPILKDFLSHLWFAIFSEIDFNDVIRPWGHVIMKKSWQKKLSLVLVPCTNHLDWVFFFLYFPNFSPHFNFNYVQHITQQGCAQCSLSFLVTWALSLLFNLCHLSETNLLRIV